MAAAVAAVVAAAIAVAAKADVEGGEALEVLLYPYSPTKPLVVISCIDIIILSLSS